MRYTSYIDLPVPAAELILSQGEMAVPLWNVCQIIPEFQPLPRRN